jgi:competence protein ComEA
MPDFTAEEKKVMLFLSAVAFCGIAINALCKLNSQVEKFLVPSVQMVRIDLNKVALEELIMTRCLPENICRNVISCRLERGGFSRLEELKEVRGIGNKRYEKVKEIFFVE